MFSRLFGNKSKTDEIEEMILILKGCGVLGKEVEKIDGVDQQKIAFGRDWYSPRYLYRGANGETKPDIYHEPSIEILNSWEIKKGPFHNKKPRGPGIQTYNPDDTPSATLSLSVIPINESNYAWARMERNRLYPGHDNGWEEFVRICKDELRCSHKDYDHLRQEKIRTRSSLLSLNDEQINTLSNPQYYRDWKAGQTINYEDEDKTVTVEAKPGVLALRERALRRLDRYKGQLRTRKQISAMDGLKNMPPTAQTMRLTVKIKKIEKSIKDYDEDIILADTYGRLYWYFVIRITKRPDGSVNLDDITLPTKLYRKHDFDKNSFIDPLWDEDNLHAVLDGMLKDYLKEQMTPASPNAAVARLAMVREENRIQSINHIDEVNRHENANLIRTLAFSRASKLNPNREEEFRLPEQSYSQRAGVSIPIEYFQTGDGKYLHDSPTIQKLNREGLDKLLEIKNVKRISARQGISEEIENFIKYKESYIVAQWPTPTQESYLESLESLKGTAIIYAYHLCNLLTAMKKDVFNDCENIFAGIECNPEIYIEMKEWYNDCIDKLVPEIIDEVLEIAPELSLHDATRKKSYFNGKFIGSESKYFEPSGPRRLSMNATVRGRRTRRAATPPRALAPIIQAVDPQPNVNQQLRGIDVEINQFLRLSQPMPLRRLMQILTNPIELFRVQLGGQPSPAAVWDLQNWPHSNNRASWNLIQELCRRWDDGDARLTTEPGLIRRPEDGGEPILDPRTAEFRAIVGQAWPNNPPPNPNERPIGDGLRNRNKTIPSVKQEDIYRGAMLLGLQMLPAVIAQLHKTLVWRVSNPMKTYSKNNKRLTTIMPGVKWFKRLVFTLCTVEGNIPLAGPLCQEWLIPADYQNLKRDFFDDKTMFEEIGLTRHGLIQDGNMVGNMIQQKMNATALKWAQHSSMETQSSLYDFQSDFNKTSDYDNLIKQFLGKTHLKDLQNYIGTKLKYQMDALEGGSGMQAKIALQEIVSLRWQKAELMIYESELQMYRDINWFCALWFGVSVVQLLLENKELGNMRALSILKLGIPTLASVGNLIYDQWGRPAGEKLPFYALNINRALYLSALIGVGQVYKELLDDSVEKENKFNVQRYEKRDDWYTWAWGKVSDIGRRFLRPYRPVSEEFVQKSQRIVPINNLRVGAQTILEPNVPRRREAMGGTRMIWFDTTFPEREYTGRVLFSESRARNVHYPPGTFFRYGGKEYLVVDDLGSMYNPKNSQNDATKKIREHAALRNGQYTTESNWEKWENILETLKEGIKSLTDSKQYRIAYCLGDNEPVLLSVAAKNTAQSFKRTIQILNAAALVMIATGIDNNPIYETDILMGNDPRLYCLGIWSIAENNMQAVPLAASIMTGIVTSNHVNGSDLIRNVVATAASTFAYDITNRWLIQNPKPSTKEEKEIYINDGWGLLIPLNIYPIESTHTRQNVWAGKFWCPITGRLIYFHSQWERENEDGDARLKKDSYQDLWFGQTQFVENGFELEWKQNMDGHMYLCLSIYPFAEQAHVNDLWRNAPAAVYHYKPSPLLTHIWFVKQGV